uniref:Uncharacterized protein n=1 Tax=Brassica oleracea TaxID=3712 RepID=A0A3P6FX79_BRAOL|nr:unnamed protein product [Brassica oleracea]
MCFCDWDFLDVDYNILKVIILSFTLCESLLFLNLFQRDCLSVLLEDKQNGSDTFWRNMVILETFEMQNCTDAYIFELAFQCHWFEVNQHPVAEVIPMLLKNGQSASREEAVEEMKDCRSMTQHWCRSTVMPEYGLSIFYDR